MKSKYFIYIICALVITPLALHAQENFTLGPGTTFSTVIYSVIDILYQLTTIAFGLAFITFFWGLSKFILNASNQAELQKGKSYMLWGVLALFILVTFRSVISIATKELGFGNASAYPLLYTGGSVDSNASKTFNPGLPQN